MGSKEAKMRHPIQPLAKDEHGTIRFKQNKIVKRLLAVATEHGMSLNDIACMDFSNEDRQQLAQLIGYSLGGYAELTNYVDDDAYNAADKMAHEGLSDKDARINSLQEELDAIRKSLKKPIARLYGIHVDDIEDLRNA